MHTLWNLFKKYQAVISYLFFGGLTTLINIGAFAWLNLYMNYQLATALAWLISVIFAFITNKLWVFNSKSMAWKVFFWETLTFFFFRLLSLGVDELIMFVGVSLLSGNALIVKIIDNVVVVVINYFFSKWIIFKK
ncbi:GtrA family protein [Lactobacillus sp. LC28-10]|uniref:GtrA family protein n=1 Tax=Secundilactobacillus angelensis TaxID=2722706 RepID=A0ABX1KXB4_9LACO|nr:GtrA family protein [Secundilactobacillus angelensis]MCH5462550.1 GtrA family protein [Secundilactobacillus angelensis]NLR18259.1 GtrA family protein [Secundilactobacillus angelensis]